MSTISNRTRSKTNSLWCSPSNLFSYVTQDPLSYILEHKNIPKETNHFREYLFNKGLDFEQKILNQLKQKVSSNLIYCFSNQDIHNNPNIYKIAEDAIRSCKHPILYNVPFKNYNHYYHGKIDLLVRNDLLPSLFKNKDLLIEKSDKLFYVVIDIKYMTLELCCQGTFILNKNLMTFYKLQILMYTQVIQQIQNYAPQYSYLLGKKYRYKKSEQIFIQDDPFYTLGVIDFKNKDIQIMDKLKESLNFCHVLKNKYIKEFDSLYSGKLQDFIRHNPSFYPNVKNRYSQWEIFTKDLAHEMNDITLLWNCGIKQRDLCHSKGIYDLYDNRLTSSLLNFKNNRKKILDSILNVNRDSKSIVLPLKIQTSLYNWRDITKTTAFLDFETVGNMFQDDDQNIVFSCGIYYFNNNTQDWSFKYLCIPVQNTLNLKNESIFLHELIEFIKENHLDKIWYWSADVHIFQKLLQKHNNDWFQNNTHIQWCDMCRLFKSEPIVVKDCFNFGLKSIVSAMYKHKLIKSHISSQCCSGMDAMIYAKIAYYNKDETLFEDIKKYNYFDVYSMFDILNYLVKHH